ncbi:putative leucine-rich repeat-containing protein DDB_G0290503 isoform X3 [Prorops nasuta]|uniref:putative leucine-rich repeat-containing protein DDB_G0290503 isoform X3 n=1 Tax=Prorops nasuta TaxID=863751 RepID=UPI0034CEBD4C
MSFLVRSPLTNYLSNDKKNLLFSDEESNSYALKYIPANQFENVIKNVRRKKVKEEEEHLWSLYVNELKTREARSSNRKSVSKFKVGKVNDLCYEQDDDLDSEPFRLEKDIHINQTKKLLSTTIPSLDKNLSIKHKLKERKSMRSKTVERICSFNNIQNADNENNKCTIMKENAINCQSPLESTLNNESIFVLNDKPHLELNYNDNKESASYIKPDPEITYKISLIQKKLIEVLNEIFHQLGKIPLPDGEDDIKRRKQRALEFAIRFSRQYLYDLNRNITEIQRNLLVFVPDAKIKLNKKGFAFYMQAIEHKLLSTYQILLNALIAYDKHIPGSILKCYPEKLKEVLQITITIKDIFKQFQPDNHAASGDSNLPSLGEEIQNKCNAILAKLHEISLETQKKDSGLLSTKRNKTERALSYRWKGSVYPKGIQKAANKQSLVNQNGHHSKQTKDNLSSLVPIVANLLSDVNNKHQQAFNTETLPLSSLETLHQYLEEQKSLNNPKSNDHLTIKCKTHNNHKKINLKPIHLKSKRSIESENKNIVENMQLINVSSERYGNNEPLFCSVSCQVNNEKIIKIGKAENIYLHKKDTKTPIIISETTKFNLQKYRDDYQSSLKLDPMYNTNSQNKPWSVVDWISDTLVNELIGDIAKEFEMNDVIQKLFQLEFQEF